VRGTQNVFADALSRMFDASSHEAVSAPCHTLLTMVMDDQDSINVTSQSLLYRLVNVLYERTLILLLNAFCHAWSHLDTYCHELLYIIGFDLYTVSMTLDAT
jgi:hypothetical protein